MSRVQGRRILITGDNIYKTLEGANPGEFFFGRIRYGEKEFDRLYFRSPNPADKAGHGVTIIREGEKPPPDTHWIWNGNLDAPTLRPSLNSTKTGGANWHGFLTAGVWIPVSG